MTTPRLCDLRATYNGRVEPLPPDLDDQARLRLVLVDSFLHFMEESGCALFKRGHHSRQLVSDQGILRLQIEWARGGV